MKTNTAGRFALVIVDMQRGYIDSSLRDVYPNAYVVDDSILKNVRRLVEASHSMGIQVFFSVIAFSNNHVDTNLWIKHIPALRALRAGSSLVEVDPRLGLDPAKDIVFDKQYPSVFSSSVFVEKLSVGGITQCIFCGITMSGCVLASIMDALPHGREPMVVRDAVADRTPLLKDIALDKVARTYGKVWSTEEAVLALSGQSK